MAVSFFCGALLGMPRPATAVEGQNPADPVASVPSGAPTPPSAAPSVPDSAAHAPGAPDPPPSAKASPDSTASSPSAPPVSGAPGQGAQAPAAKPPGEKPAAEKSASEKAAAEKPEPGNAPAEKSAPGKPAASRVTPPKPGGAKPSAPDSSRVPPVRSKRVAGQSAARKAAASKAPAHKRGASAPTRKGAAAKTATRHDSPVRPDAPPQTRHDSSSSGTSLASSASEGSEADNVAREIERTALWMARANAVVPRSRNARAIDLLGSADQFQQDARSTYELRQYARAQRLTLAARDYADRSTRIVGPATDDPEYVESVLERTDDALDRLKDMLRSSEGSRDRNQYESLRDEQKDAWKQLHDGDVRDAYASTTRVRDGVLSVIQRLPEVPISCDAAEKAVRNAERAREKAAGDLGLKPAVDAAKRLAQADGQLSKARGYLDRGDCREALLRAKVAEQQLERAVDAARPTR